MKRFARVLGGILTAVGAILAVSLIVSLPALLKNGDMSLPGRLFGVLVFGALSALLIRAGIRLRTPRDDVRPVGTGASRSPGPASAPVQKKEPAPDPAGTATEHSAVYCENPCANRSEKGDVDTLSSGFDHGKPFVSVICAWSEGADGGGAGDTQFVPGDIQPTLTPDSLHKWMRSAFAPGYTAHLQDDLFAPYGPVADWCRQVRFASALALPEGVYLLQNPFEQKLRGVGPDGLTDKSGVSLWLGIVPGADLKALLSGLASWHGSLQSRSAALKKDFILDTPYLFDPARRIVILTEGDAAHVPDPFLLARLTDRGIRDLSTGEEHAFRFEEYPGSADDAATYGVWYLLPPRPQRNERMEPNMVKPTNTESAQSRRTYTLSDFTPDAKLSAEPGMAPDSIITSFRLGRFALEGGTLFALTEEWMEYASSRTQAYSILRADYDRLLASGRVTNEDMRRIRPFSHTLLEVHAQHMAPPQGTFAGPGPKPSFSGEEAASELKRLRTTENASFAHTDPGIYTGDEDDRLLFFGQAESKYTSGGPCDEFDSIRYLFGTYYLHYVSCGRTHAAEIYYPFPFHLLDGDGCVTFRDLRDHMASLRPGANLLSAGFSAAARDNALKQGWKKKDFRFWRGDDLIRLLRPWQRTEYTITDAGSECWLEGPGKPPLRLAEARVMGDQGRGRIPEILYASEIERSERQEALDILKRELRQDMIVREDADQISILWKERPYAPEYVISEKGLAVSGDRGSWILLLQLGSAAQNLLAAAVYLGEDYVTSAREWNEHYRASHASGDFREAAWVKDCIDTHVDRDRCREGRVCALPREDRMAVYCTLGGETDCLTETSASGDTWYDPAARAALGLDSIDAFEKRNGPRFDAEGKRSLLCLCATGLGRVRKEQKEQPPRAEDR